MDQIYYSGRYRLRCYSLAGVETMQTQPTHEQSKKSLSRNSQPDTARNASGAVSRTRKRSTLSEWINVAVAAITAALGVTSLWILFLNPFNLIWIGTSLVAVAATAYSWQSTQGGAHEAAEDVSTEIGRASCRERV